MGDMSMFFTKTHHRAKEFYIYRSFQPKIDVKKGDRYTKAKEQITAKWPSLARLNSGCASPVDIELLGYPTIKTSQEGVNQLLISHFRFRSNGFSNVEDVTCLRRQMF